jgi:hypothetical protein
MPTAAEDTKDNQKTVSYLETTEQQDTGLQSTPDPDSQARRRRRNTMSLLHSTDPFMSNKLNEIPSSGLNKGGGGKPEVEGGVESKREK